MSIGFEVLYPDGCEEIDFSLRSDELRKRVNDINAALRDILRQTGLSDESVEDDSQNQQTITEAQKPFQLTGLLLHLLSPQFTEHSDIDIRLRIGVAICTLLKLFCPTNPFETLSDAQDRIRNLLKFFNEALSNISRLHSKHDVNYPRLFTIVYTCCKLDVFSWCRLLDDGDLYLLNSMKTLIGITKNLHVWAWSDEETVYQFILNTLVTLIQQSSALLTDAVLAYLLFFLIEPAKSSQPVQHSLVKDVIIRAAAQLEYPVQMLIQNSLVTSDQNSSDKSLNGSSVGHLHDPLGEHSFVIIYALHTLQESLVAPILPCIELKLKSNVARERKRAFRLLARIFSEPNSTVHLKSSELWAAFLTRFHDIDADVRSFCIQMVPLMLKQNPDLPRNRLIECLQSCTIDKIESVRLLALKVVAALMNEAKNCNIDSLFEIIFTRSRDRSFAVRKEVLSELAQIYKQHLSSPNPNHEKMTMILNAIMHMYYQPSNDDKITVERLFKSYIVPYNFETKERVRSLCICYQLADDATIKAIQELLKIQFTGSVLMREALRLIVENPGKKVTGRAGAELMHPLRKLSNLLPKSEKALDHLKKFFNTVHSDRALKNSCCQLFSMNYSSKLSAQCMRDILKRVSTQSQNVSSNDKMQYEHTVKLLLERCASVLFDEAFGQEILTRLVVAMETAAVGKSNEAMSASTELVRDLRILLALSVYHKDSLPADDVFQYINSIFDTYRNVPVPEIPAESKSEDDPSTPIELSLQILCCLLGGGPIYGPKDAGGSGANWDQYAVVLSNSKEVEKQSSSAKTSSSKPRICRLYSGSLEQLHDQTLKLLPWLKTFCNNGITADYPPINNLGYSSGNRTKSKGQQNEKISVGQAGLAWRREKGRAKLAVRVLHQLFSVIHILAGKHSSFPKGLVSSIDGQQDGSFVEEKEDIITGAQDVDETTAAANNDGIGIPGNNTEPEIIVPEGDKDIIASSPSDSPQMALLEVKLQQTLDSIVKVSLACKPTSADYISCLTCLSHIGLLFPGVYNPQLKALMIGHIIPNLLTRDEGPQSTQDVHPKKGGHRSKNQLSGLVSDSSQPSDWTLDGNVPQLTRAKIAAVKLMANWLVGLKLQNRQVAQVIIRLFRRIIVHDGDLTRKGLMSFGDMSRMRLVAATSWLKVAHIQFYAEVVEVSWFQSMSYVICDPCQNVRSHFLDVLHRGLMQLNIPLEYIAMFAHVADVPDLGFRQRAKQCLIANVKRRREFLARHEPFNGNPKLLFALLPDFVLVYAIHLLAHDPDWQNPNDVSRLVIAKSALWFIMEPLITGANNYAFLRQILEKIKHSLDALCPTDEVANNKIYILCDISLGLLLTRCTNLVWKGCQFEIKLPRTLFSPAPSSFSNPEFAQLCHGGDSDSAETPLITFTPHKHAKAVKDGLIPTKFLHHKATSQKPSVRPLEVVNVMATNTEKDESESGAANFEVDLDEKEECDGLLDVSRPSGDSAVADEMGKNEGSTVPGTKRRRRGSNDVEVDSKRHKKDNIRVVTKASSKGIEKIGLKQTKLSTSKKSRTTRLSLRNSATRNVKSNNAPKPVKRTRKT